MSSRARPQHHRVERSRCQLCDPRLLRTIARWLKGKELGALSPLPPGEGPGMRGPGRGISPRAGRYPLFAHPKPLSLRERGFTPIQCEMFLPRLLSVARPHTGSGT